MSASLKYFITMVKYDFHHDLLDFVLAMNSSIMMMNSCKVFICRDCCTHLHDKEIHIMADGTLHTHAHTFCDQTTGRIIMLNFAQGIF